jgi:hypothetical protein
VTLTMAAERRVSGLADRRMLRRGGRRKDDADPDSWELDLRLACEACGTGWASISSFTHGGQPMLCIACPRCGHIERLVGAA